MATYSFARCLENSARVNWRIDEVLGERRFDLGKRWLPATLSGAGQASCLSADEQRKLTHVEMASYAHLFGYVEEFIAPKVCELASDHALGDRTAFDALTSFAAEEVKHRMLFRRLRERVDATLGFELALVDGELETARWVLGKSTGAVLLLTACIEWFTQLHFTDAFREDGGLDDLTRHVFRAHWQEESQHAQMDHLETVRVFQGLSDEERDLATDDLIELVAGVEGLLRKQVGHDLTNLAVYLGRGFDAAERSELEAAILRAKRYTFLESGLSHPRFQELFVQVTEEAQRERVAHALAGILAPEPSAC